jgi:hypothetical protein
MKACDFPTCNHGAELQIEHERDVRYTCLAHAQDLVRDLLQMPDLEMEVERGIEKGLYVVHVRHPTDSRRAAGLLILGVDCAE